MSAGASSAAVLAAMCIADFELASPVCPPKNVVVLRAEALEFFARPVSCFLSAGQCVDRATLTVSCF